MNRIAIIGFSCRVPGADNVPAFWDNLLARKCSISHFGASVPEAHKLQYPEVIYAKGLISGPNLFDCQYFKISQREAAIMDPQLRLLLTCSREAFADSDIAPEEADEKTSVWMTSNYNSYCNFAEKTSRSPSEKLLYRTLNDSNFAAGRVSYHLDLKGESVSLGTACSSSLVAVHLAARSLASGASNLALVGGASVVFPPEQGYVYRDGMIYSKDGYCRPFSRDASGVVEGDGVVCCLLKRLNDAVADGNPVYAVIEGSCINHDGGEKIGFTAPGVVGMRNCILGAQKAAGVQPGQISFIEAHGTGTKLGDQLEVAVLKEIFGGKDGDAVHLQSAKANCGHLIHAAGLLGLMKAALSLNNNCLPPQASFTLPNPELELEKTPFKVNTEFLPLVPKTKEGPVYASVSSFGMAGTNSHAVLSKSQDYPAHDLSAPQVGWQLKNCWLDPAVIYPGMLAEAEKPSAVVEISADVVQREVQNFLADYNVTGELSPDIEIADLGLDSLLILELTDRLNKAAGLQIPYKDILRAKTIGGIFKIYEK